MGKLEELKAELNKLGREYAKIKTLQAAERKSFGEKLNRQKAALLAAIKDAEDAAESENLEPIDLTAPFGENATPFAPTQGTKHPLNTELDRVADI